ncbi:hypothetical protein PMAYCL1PPCAC_24347, partial [Pristionchus mayeri]
IHLSPFISSLVVVSSVQVFPYLSSLYRTCIFSEAMSWIEASLSTISLSQILQCIVLSSLLILPILTGCSKKKGKTNASPSAIAADKAANAPKAASKEPVKKLPNQPSSGGGAAVPVAKPQPPSSEEKKENEKKDEVKEEKKEE